MRSFKQVDVFTADPYFGNPVAVVLGADGMSTEDMQRFANWTNLSETTFVMAPEDPVADYKVRIFTTVAELPFAGHPTIGTCHAWLEAGGEPKTPGTVVQECGLGLVNLRSADGRLAFAAPDLLRSGPVSDEEITMACAVLQIDRSQVIEAQWCDNGPGWIGLLLDSAQTVLNIEPDYSAAEAYDIGIVGRAPIGIAGAHDGGEAAIEVRAFFRSNGAAVEDPVTGSLNAALAMWLVGNGTLATPYVAAQGTALGRRGRVYVDSADDELWIGGDAVTAIEGSVDL